MNERGFHVWNRNITGAPGFFMADREARPMLRRALVFFTLALIAGFLGFFSLAGVAGEIAKILLVAFVALFLISALSGALAGTPPAV